VSQINEVFGGRRAGRTDDKRQPGIPFHPQGTGISAGTTNQALARTNANPYPPRNARIQLAEQIPTRPALGDKTAGDNAIARANAGAPVIVHKRDHARDYAAPPSSSPNLFPSDAQGSEPQFGALFDA